jgi:hypothetical protein
MKASKENFSGDEKQFAQPEDSRDINSDFFYYEILDDFRHQLFSRSG